MSDYEILIPMKKDMELRLLLELLDNIGQVYNARGQKLCVNVGHDGNGEFLEMAISLATGE